MIGDESIRKRLEEEMLAYYRHVCRFRKRGVDLNLHVRGRGLSLHEYVKGLLFALGREQGFLPLPEYRPDRDRQTRVDLIWVDDMGQAAAAFEIDQTLYNKSVNKLLLLLAGCRKYIVSIGRGTKTIQESRLAGTGIVLFDLTQARLGILQHFSSGGQISLF